MAEFLCKSYGHPQPVHEIPGDTLTCTLPKKHHGNHRNGVFWWVSNGATALPIKGAELLLDMGAPKTQFPGGGMRDVVGDRERFDLIWAAAQSYDDQMLVRFARHLAAGAKKYAERNWEEFSGPEAEQHAIGSLLRHVFKLISGQNDEDHAAAVWFNAQAIELIRGKESKNDEG